MQTRGNSLGAVMFGVLLSLLVGTVGCGMSEQKAERKAFGQTCASDAECESQQCAGHGKVCTKSCTFDKECGDGLVCRGLDSGKGMQCGKPEGNKVGSPCQTPAECDHGLCVKKADAPAEPGFCSRTCQGPGECPDGHKQCESQTDGANKMCLAGDVGAQGSVVGAQTVGGPTKPTPTPSGTTAPSAEPVPSGTTAPSAPPPVDAGAPPPPPRVLDAGIRLGPVAPPAGTGSTRPRIKLGK